MLRHGRCCAGTRMDLAGNALPLGLAAAVVRC